MPATTTTLATLVRPVVDADATIIKYTNRDFFRSLRALGMKDVIAVGDSNFRWKVDRGAGNTSTQVFAEGQGAPAAGSQTWVEAALAWVYHRVFVEISGHAVDQLGSQYLGGAEYGEAALFGEVPRAVDDLEDLMANTFLGSANNGIQAAVDDGSGTGTYAGIVRATSTDWQSGLRAVGGASAVAEFTLGWETSRDNDRGGILDAWLMPWNQVTNYVALVGPEHATAAARLVRYMAPAAGVGNLDIGFNVETGLSFNNGRIYGIGDLTDTVILGLSSPEWLFATIRQVRQDDQPREGDTRARMQISTGGTLVCRNPRTQYKMTGVTA